MTRGQHRCIDDSEESKGSRLSTSRAPPTSTTTNTRQPALKPITALIAPIKSELGLPPVPPVTSISDTIFMAMPSLGLPFAGTMALIHDTGSWYSRRRGIVCRRVNEHTASGSLRGANEAQFRL